MGKLIRKPPQGVYRKRLCFKCKVLLQVDGFLVNAERGTLGHGTCENCGKRDALSAVYRYTLSARARKARGWDA